MPYGLLRWTVVDLYGPGNPSEKRKVDSSILSLTTHSHQRILLSYLREPRSWRLATAAL